MTSPWMFSGSAPPQVTPCTLNSSHLARWLGQKAGVTPTWAQQLIEPYTDHQNWGCYYGQVAHDQAEVKRAHQAHNNTLLTSPGTAGLPTGSLAAHISMASVTGATEPSIIPILGALLLAGPSTPPPAASTSMDVNYGNPLTDPPSEGNENDASGWHKDLDAREGQGSRDPPGVAGKGTDG